MLTSHIRNGSMANRGNGKAMPQRRQYDSHMSSGLVMEEKDEPAAAKCE